jgi:hypothetical protein
MHPTLASTSSVVLLVVALRRRPTTVLLHLRQAAEVTALDPHPRPHPPEAILDLHPHLPEAAGTDECSLSSGDVRYDIAGRNL